MLCDHEIKRERKNGLVVIEPFNERQLMSASYDLTLGEHFYFRRDNDRRVLDPRGSEEVAKEWLYFHAKNGGTHLHPGEIVLGHTREYVGGRIGDVFTVNMTLATTSTAARLGLSAHPSAGFGDPGYVNRWTLEIYNYGPVPIFLPVGACICQAVFHWMETPERGYSQRAGSGNYCATDDVEQLKKFWKPSDMLPKRLKVYKEIGE